MLADNTRDGKILYGLMAAIVWFSYVGIVAWKQMTVSKEEGTNEERPTSSEQPIRTTTEMESLNEA